MASSIDLQEKANFSRLSRLLVDKGTEALRNTLDAIHPPANLAAALKANRETLLKLNPRVINATQWDLLFHPSGNPPDSKTFDVSLLTVLLRNICGFSASATGWNTMPPDADRSPQANFTRIRLLRNEVYAHVSSTQVDAATFENLWQKISHALVELKIPRNETDDLKNCSLSPEEERLMHTLKEWTLKDEELLSDILSGQQTIQASVNEKSEEIRKEIQKLREDNSRQSERLVEAKLRKLAKHSFKSKIKANAKKFHPKTRGWALERLNKWFTPEDESRFLLLTAGPGFGKTVFAAKVCDVFGQKAKLAACHFCEFNDSNLNDPMIMLESLASQMCENVPGFKEKLLDQLGRSPRIQKLKDAFQIYLQNPLNELEEEPRLIVIDGLDESASDSKRDMVKLFAENFPELPACVKVLVTSRPEKSLERLRHAKKIDIAADHKENTSDLQQYLRARLPSLFVMAAASDSTEAHREPFVPPAALIVIQCEGSFLYAFHLQQELRKCENLNYMSVPEIMSILPRGMSSVYEDYFHRLETELEAVMKRKPDLGNLLQLLVDAYRPFPLTFFARALGLAPDCRETKQIINKVNEAVSCLFNVSDGWVTAFHSSVYDWLMAHGYEDHEYTVKVGDGKKQLWQLCEPFLQEIKATVSSGRDLKLTNEVKHALRSGLTYLVECNMVESFSWLVDMIIVHCISTLHPRPTIQLRHLWKEVLLERHGAINPEVQQRISWHAKEICFLDDYGILPSSNTKEVIPFYYLNAVIYRFPEGCFSEEEKKTAHQLLAKVSSYENSLSKVFPSGRGFK